MNLQIEDAVIIEGVARAAERLLASEDFAERIADALVARMDLLDPVAAAALLGVTTRTLAERAKEWGLDKSLAFGSTNPRYFLSQVLERARAKVIAGRGRMPVALPKARSAA